MVKETLLALLQETVDKVPNRFYTFRKTDEGWLGTTFLQMQQRAQALATYFYKKELLGALDKMAILAEGSPEWALAEMGAYHVRAVGVPLSMKLLQEELQFRIEHSDSKLIACSSLSWARVKEMLAKTTAKLKVLWLDDNVESIKKSISAGEITSEHVIFLQEALTQGQTMLADKAINTEMQAVFNSVDPDDLASISYSSGTTGSPKGVMLTHRNYYVNTTYSKEFYPVVPGSTMLLILPVDHAFGHTIGLYTCIFMQMELYFVDARGGVPGIIRSIPENIQEVKPAMLPVVPALTGSFMKKIVSGVEAAGPVSKVLFHWSLNATIKVNGNIIKRGSFFTQVANFLPVQLGKKVIFPKIRKALPVGLMLGGGALFDRKTQEFFEAIGIPLCQGYGMTESAPLIAGSGLLKNSRKIGFIGPFFTGVEGTIMRSDGTIANTGEKGEIVVKSQSVMQGYYKNPETTAETLREGWLHTGDLGMMDENGFLAIMGREKALLINKDGEKFSPEEIEEAMMAGSYVDQAMLYCDHNPYAVAVVVINRAALVSMVKNLNDKGLLGSLTSVISGVSSSVSSSVSSMLDKDKVKVKKNALDNALDLTKILEQLTEHVFSFKQDAQNQKSFPKLWLPNTFYIVTEPLELNSTMKMIRHKVITRYKEEIDYMYTPLGSQVVNPHNIETLTTLLKEEGLLK